MAEYIEREALMRRIKEIHCDECDSYHGLRCRACWVDDTLDYIDSEPAADVEKMSDGYHTFADLYEQRLILSAALAKNNPHAWKSKRHGRWEEASDGDGIVCPFCRTDFCTIIYDTEYFNYCPNCGAKMDETVEENKE